MSLSLLGAAKDILNNLRQVAEDKARELQEERLRLRDHSSQLTSPIVSPEVRVARFKRELLASKIDLAELKRLAFQGIPDRDGLRAITWKLLLGYLPPDPSEWDEVLARRRTQYLLFCEDLIMDHKKIKAAEEEELGGSGSPAIGPLAADATPAAESSGRATEGASPHALPLSHSKADLQPQGTAAKDHPLSLQSTSRWHTFFQDNEVMEQIERDVMRTHPDMHFFSGEVEEAEQHRMEMRRALFLYAKLNPGVRYIQGMNELYAPLYWAFKTDTDTSSARYAEADAFFCFVDLMAEVRDHFCVSLDNSASGIKATIARLMAALRATDAQLLAHLQEMKIDPQFFAFRWITLLLSQEFPLPDVVRIWDTLFSDGAGRMDCLMRVCLAMLQHVRPRLLGGDFATNVQLLQRFPSVDVDVLLRAAAAMPPVAAVLGERV